MLVIASSLSCLRWWGVRLVVPAALHVDPCCWEPARSYDQLETWECHSIEITGLKDARLVGERMIFPILSGYGHVRGSREAAFPEQSVDPVVCLKLN